MKLKVSWHFRFNWKLINLKSLWNTFSGHANVLICNCIFQGKVYLHYIFCKQKVVTDKNEIPTLFVNVSNIPPSLSSPVSISSWNVPHIVQQFLFIFFCTCIVGGGHPLICPRNHLRGGCETVTPPPHRLEPRCLHPDCVNWRNFSKKRQIHITKSHNHKDSQSGV